MKPWNELSLKEREYTMIEPEGMEVVLQTVAEAPEGIIVIAGSAHGGDAMAIMKQFPNRYVVVIDSFEGLAEPTEKDGTDVEGKGGHSCGGIDQYKANFAELNRPLPHEIFKMWITPESLEEIKDREIACLFMDLDHYQPVKACLLHFWPMLVKDAKVITHDWKFFRTKGVEVACEEFKPGKWESIRGFGKYTGVIE